MASTRRKITVISLFILVFFLTGLAIFFAIRLQESQAPSDSSADSFCSGASQCPDGQPVNYGGDRCYVWKYTSNADGCGGLGKCESVNNCAPATPGCSVTFPGGAVGGQIVINNCPTEFKMESYWRDAPRGSTASSCVGTNSNGYIRNVGNGNYNPVNDSIGCGKCVQYDIDDQGIKGGVANYTGDCPETTITCYKCTDILTDGDLCESKSVKGVNPSCPTGYTTNTNCAQSVGGACATPNNLTCYRCTSATNDGNLCESFVTTNNQCPAGSTPTAGECALAQDLKSCPADVPVSYPEVPKLPETALFDESVDRIFVGFILVLLGIFIYKLDITKKLNTYVYVAKNLDIKDEYKAIEHEKKIKKLKKTRKSFENKVDESFSKKKPYK